MSLRVLEWDQWDELWAGWTQLPVAGGLGRTLRTSTGDKRYCTLENTGNRLFFLSNSFISQSGERFALPAELSKGWRVSRE